MDILKTKFDIVIQGGQSNSEGYGLGPVASEIMPIISENVMYLEAEKTVDILEDNMQITYADKMFEILPAAEGVSEGVPVGNFALSFAEAYENTGLLQKDRKLLIIRAAVGGSGFKKGHWGPEKQLYIKMLEMTDYALSLNKENRVVAFLWHQGEHDAFEKNDPEVFKEQLAAVLKGVRFRYGAEIPFVAGDFVSEWKNKNLEDCLPIVQSIREVTAEGGNAAFVETADLTSNNQKVGNGDDIHFCRESLYILGRRYFSAFKEIVE